MYVECCVVFEIKVSPTMHLSTVIHPFTTSGGAGVYLSILGRRWGRPWTSCQFIAGLTYRDKQPSTLIFTPTDNLMWPINQLTPSLHVFGMWEEAGEPSKNPRRHRENMPSPHRNPLTLNQIQDLWGNRANNYTTVFSHCFYPKIPQADWFCALTLSQVN